MDENLRGARHRFARSDPGRIVPGRGAAPARSHLEIRQHRGAAAKRLRGHVADRTLPSVTSTDDAPRSVMPTAAEAGLAATGFEAVVVALIVVAIAELAVV